MVIRLNSSFNVLISSVGAKIPLVREVRRAMEKFAPAGRVYGADCNPDCLGRYFVDVFWELPPLENLSPEQLEEYCIENQILAIIPTRDGELEYFARQKMTLRRHGISVMTSSPATVRACCDKMLFYEILNNYARIQPIYTTRTPDAGMASRWVVKERFGAGSRHLYLDLSPEKALSLGSELEHPIYQPYIEGSEFSVDIYCNMHGHNMGAVVRSRDQVIDGESQVTTTVNKPKVETLCRMAAEALELTCHGVFQVIEDADGNPHLLECNCRFGGASSLSIAAGLDSFYWFFQECLGGGVAPEFFKRSCRQLRQIRYPEDKIVQVAPNDGARP